MRLNPFEVLVLAADATMGEIKRSYRVLSKQFHPDLHPNNAEMEARFREVQWAYETLSRRERRNSKDGRNAQREERPASGACSEKPFAGSFWAMKAYAARRRSRNDGMVSHYRDGFSQDR